jgi:hypothetical protein
MIATITNKARPRPFNRWSKQLITKEDHLHLHKALGFLCLAFFAWRFALLFDETSDLGFGIYPQWTIPTILLHLCLNLSSFEFKIPERRITTGYRIWPEYRLHSLVFLVRSLAINHQTIGGIYLLYWQPCFAATCAVLLKSTDHRPFASSMPRLLSSTIFLLCNFALRPVVSTDCDDTR